mgnify:CR=1 FL=1
MLAEVVGIALVIADVLKTVPAGQLSIEQMLEALRVHNVNPSLKLVVIFANSTFSTDFVTLLTIALCEVTIVFIGSVSVFGFTIIVVVPGIFETPGLVVPEGFAFDEPPEFTEGDSLPFVVESLADFEPSSLFAVAGLVVVAEGAVVPDFAPGEVAVLGAVVVFEDFAPSLDFELSLDSLAAKPFIIEELINIKKTRKTKKDNTTKGITLSFFISLSRLYYL